MSRIAQFIVISLVASASAACAVGMEDGYQPDSIGTVEQAVQSESQADQKAAKAAEQDAKKAEQDAKRDAKKAEQDAKRDAKKAEQDAEKAARQAARELARQARLDERFERYAADSSPAEFEWFGIGAKAHFKVTGEQASSGVQSLSLVPDPSVAWPRVGSKVCAQVGSTTGMSASFRFRVADLGAQDWAYIGVSGNPTIAAYWWVMGDGTVTNFVDDLGKIEPNKWNDVSIDLDVANDLATVTLNGNTVTSSIEAVWGQTDEPLECLRLSASVKMFADDVVIQPQTDGLVAID